MALAHRDKHFLDWPEFGWPERWRRFFDVEGEMTGWLRVEEFRDDDSLVVRAELPDIDPERDVEVTSGDSTVRIRAHREEKADHADKQGYRSEFRYGEFEREIALPEGATARDVTATYTDGILEVRIPCPEHEETAPTKVPVTRA